MEPEGFRTERRASYASSGCALATRFMPVWVPSAQRSQSRRGRHASRERPALVPEGVKNGVHPVRRSASTPLSSQSRLP